MKPLTRILVSLGFAEGLMMGNWSRVFDPGTQYFYETQPVGLVIACYLLMLVVAAMVFACTYLPAKFRWLIIPFALLMADNLRLGLSIPAIPFAIVLLVLVGLTFQAVKKRKTTWLRAGTLSLEILGYASVVTLLAGITLFLRPPYKEPVVAQSKKAGPRIVIAIFDELDPAHALENWPKGRPENRFHSMATRALNFKNCEQPGGETMYSLPAITIGQRVDKAKPMTDRDLNLIVGGQKRTWDEKPNIILEAKDTIGASMFGWYHPYNRLFAGIEGKAMERAPSSTAFSFWFLFDCMIARPFQMVGKNSQTKILNTFYSNRQRSMIEEFHSQSTEFTEKHHGLIFYHIPCPHVPYVMRPIEGDPLGFDIQSYYGAVEYAGEICRSIESTLAETGEPYTLIATSDHNLRAVLNGIKPCGRVPMLMVGTNLKPQTVEQTAYCEHVAEVVRLLIKDPKATQDEIVKVMTSPRN
jgi:hypothetical protein